MDNNTPIYARIIMRELAGKGIAPDDLLKEASLTPSSLATVDDITREDFSSILLAAMRLCPEIRPGLLLGEHVSIPAIGGIGTAAVTAPTLRDGLLVIENYARLNLSYSWMRLSAGIKRMSICIGVSDLTGNLRRIHMEAATLMMQDFVRVVTGHKLQDGVVSFDMARPDYADEYENLYRSPITYDGEETSIAIPVHLLSYRSPYFNEEIWQESTRYMARGLKALDAEQHQPYTHYVHALLRSSDTPLPDLGEVASRLHISERTLNRRLQLEGTTFRDIRGKVLANWARQHLLQTDSSVESIALTLGYENVANFRRAFRKAEGCSPSEYRDRKSA